MKFLIKTTSLILIIHLFACSSKETKNDIKEEIVEETTSIDKAIINDTAQKIYQVKEQQENLEKIEKQFGTQWDFCTCVIINDSIDKAIKNMTDFESIEAEKLFERLEFVSNKCKAFLNMNPNKTPEDREKHLKKVKKCLSKVK